MLLYHDFFDVPVPELIKRIQKILFDIAVKGFFNFSEIWKRLTSVPECLAWRMMKSINIHVHVTYNKQSSALSLWCLYGVLVSFYVTKFMQIMHVQCAMKVLSKTLGQRILQSG